MNFSKNFILKLALFATGLSGIVAEYVLATLASYFLGDSIKQWALIISLMLFCMGLGSRLTQSISKSLYLWFIGIEFALSLVVSFSALLAYTTASFSNYTGILIYGLAIITGLFIGMELPLAMRLNERFESLKINVSSILEQDYYGSLLGGLFFAFIGLPYLGLTYTPFLLGFINLFVAIALLNSFKAEKEQIPKKTLNILALCIAGIIGLGIINAEKIILFGEQKKYKDKIVYSEQSAYQKIVLTEWKNDHWLYLDGHLQFSSYDEELYHEVLVHPAVHLANRPQRVLIMGGGDGCAARELLKYPFIQKIEIVDIDPAITHLAKTNKDLIEINKNALNSEKVEVHNADGFIFLEKNASFYDLIIIDLPDPRSVELARLYSLEFYQLCRKRLRENGVLITQAGSPYFAPLSFKCIEKTIANANFSTLAMHNQIITMGEWGWIIGNKEQVSKKEILARLKTINLDKIETAWINKEAIDLITSFGKDFFIENNRDSIEINQIHDPVLSRYYFDSRWDVY